MTRHYRALKRAIFSSILCIVCCCQLVFSQAVAQSLDQDKLAAVITVLNLFLLEEDITEVQIEFNRFDDRSYGFSKQFDVGFDGQAQDVELCFIFTSNSGSLGTDISVSLNGENTLTVTQGENCFVIPADQQESLNNLIFTVNSSGISARLKRISVEPAQQSRLTLSSLTRSNWDQRAVRKVLKIFAFGGHTRDAQIVDWANMQPRVAVAQMLNFSEHNLKLSPLTPGEQYRESASDYGRLSTFSGFLSSSASNLPIPDSERRQFRTTEDNFEASFSRMATTRGLNPFRQRIGFWETNYHLAVNLDTEVNSRQMAHYYDSIMNAHASGTPYSSVMSAAARSAAAATQYGHRNNEWNGIANECRCNDDFAREIHQLYFGIFGVNDPLHEERTIRDTARMLTDMPVELTENGFDNVVTFGINNHHRPDLQIFGRPISGTDARVKINRLMPISIQQDESLYNLPIMIISGLADDNLDEARSDQIRDAWAAMPRNNKNFLQFIHSYAVSDMFHSPEQFKYLTSHERAIYKANKFNLDNVESYLGGERFDGSDARAGVNIERRIDRDNAGEVFRPLHNVFGGQTALAAADSSLVFETNYNLATEEEDRLREAVSCDNCNNGQPWEKIWDKILPRSDGRYVVADVAEWLWMHVVGNLDNYTSLEKAHLYSILGSARSVSGPNNQDHFLDFALFVCMVDDYKSKVANPNLGIGNLLSTNVWGQYCRPGGDPGDGGDYTQVERDALNRVFTGQDIDADPELRQLLSRLGQVSLRLDSPGETLRRRSRERVNAAMNFIFSTPFVFAEGANNE